MRPSSLLILLAASLMLSSPAAAVPIEIEMEAFVGEGFGIPPLQRGDRLEIVYTLETDATADSDPPEPYEVSYAGAVLSLSAFAPERGITLAGAAGDFLLADEQVVAPGETRDLVNLQPAQAAMGGLVLAFVDDTSGTMLDSLALPTAPLVFEYGYALAVQSTVLVYQYELFPTRALALPEPTAGLLLAAGLVGLRRRLR
jgi:hypothetical protein